MIEDKNIIEDLNEMLNDFLKKADLGAKPDEKIVDSLKRILNHCDEIATKHMIAGVEASQMIDLPLEAYAVSQFKMSCHFICTSMRCSRKRSSEDIRRNLYTLVDHAVRKSKLGMDEHERKKKAKG